MLKEGIIMKSLLEINTAEIAENSKEILDIADKIEQHLLGGVHMLVEIRDALKFTNQKKVEQSVGEHRIGALRRISSAIEYINSLTPDCLTDATAEYSAIKNLLLGIGGD